MINGFSQSELAHLYSLTGCSDPGLLRLDYELLSAWHPEWFRSGVFGFLFGKYSLRKNYFDVANHVRSQLLLGDRSPAIVVNEKPFLVAAYSEEQDAVVLLEFDRRRIPISFPKLGTRLITLNWDYSDSFGPLADDLRPGPNSSNNWNNFLPLIGDFLSSETGRLNELKESVPESWWSHTLDLAHSYDRTNGVRDGRPGYAANPQFSRNKWRTVDSGR